MYPQRTKLRIELIFILLILLVDQVSKAIFVTGCNSGIAFSLLASWGAWNIFNAIILLGFCLYFFFKEGRFKYSPMLALIIGGGVSNLVDRLVLGCVRDFLDFKIWPSLTWLSPSLTRWPSFNIADSAIFAGVMIIVLKSLFVKNGTRN